MKKDYPVAGDNAGSRTFCVNRKLTKLFYVDPVAMCKTLIYVMYCDMLEKIRNVAMPEFSHLHVS